MPLQRTASRRWGTVRSWKRPSLSKLVDQAFPYPSRVGVHGHAPVIEGFRAQSAVARLAAFDLA
jgi:hypothetical protein